MKYMQRHSPNGGVIKISLLRSVGVFDFGPGLGQISRVQSLAWFLARAGQSGQTEASDWKPAHHY